MRPDRSAQMQRHHLRPEAHAQKRLVLFQRHADPVDFAADPRIGIIGAHRPAENHRTRMIFHRLGQVLAEAGPPDVEAIAALGEHHADAAGRRGFGMEDDEDLARHSARV